MPSTSASPRQARFDQFRGARHGGGVPRARSDRSGGRRTGPRAQRDHLRRALPPRPAAQPAAPAAGQGAVRAPLGRAGRPARPARTPPTCRGCCSQSMLADANEISQQFSGQGSMWQNPFANPDPRAGGRRRVGVVHRLPALADHPARASRSWPRMADEELWKAFADDRHRGPAHRPGQAGRRHLGLAVHPERRRPLRPDQHPDRPGVRHRGRVPDDVRHRQLVRRHDHRRRRARPHRQGRGLPARRDEVRRLPRHLPHGRDRARGLEPLPDVPAGRGLGQHRRRHRGVAGEGRLHHRPPAAGDLLRRGRQGDQLERDPAGRRRRRRRAALGLPALLQGRASPRSTGWTRRSPACGWSSATRCTR